MTSTSTLQSGSPRRSENLLRHSLRRRAEFQIALVFVLLWASAAHAQRIPEAALWFAGASLFAPFVAVPVKLGILRLMALESEPSRLWQISAIEWVLWFPAAFILLRSDGLSSAPQTILALFGLVTWLHRVRIANARWGSAFLLTLPTPMLALLLPFLAFAAASYIESLGAT
jgi:hypothetical protein